MAHNTPHALNYMHINNNFIIFQYKNPMEGICDGEEVKFI
jgi:hypothetical protein